MTIQGSADSTVSHLNMSDSASFEAAVRPHQTSMLRLAARLARRQQPEDVVQNALLRAWRYRGRFDERKGALSSWLLAITANEAFRMEHSSRRIPSWQSPEEQPSADDRLDVQEAVRRLSRRQRLAVDCHYYVGLSISETAAVMRCAEGTVKSTLADARESIRKTLEVGS